tara:strand:- start:557 stop:925 length:369 start_codon:yes stop_codon:yes gene_type:complete
MFKKTTKDVYIDAECAMCTSFGDWVKVNCENIVVVSNKEIEKTFLSNVVQHSIIVLDGKYIYTKSRGIIEILKSHKNFLVRYPFSIIGAFYDLISLNIVYDFVAKRRLMMFKKKEHCSWEKK